MTTLITAAKETRKSLALVVDDVMNQPTVSPSVFKYDGLEPPW